MNKLTTYDLVILYDVFKTKINETDEDKARCSRVEDILRRIVDGIVTDDGIESIIKKIFETMPPKGDTK